MRPNAMKGLFCGVLVLVFASEMPNQRIFAAGSAPSPAASVAPASSPVASPAATPTSAVPPSGISATGTWTKEQAKKVLKDAEEIRSLDRAEVAVNLKTRASGKNTDYDMKVLRSTERRAYLEFLTPQEERGRKMLAQGNNYWSTFPDSKRVVTISRREMIGNSAFAIADIFQMDAESDYDPEITAREVRNGLALLKLKLTAKHKDAPYALVEYLVEEKGSFPFEAKFFGVSGKHLKTMTVESKRQLGGRLRPETLKMVDEVTKGTVSWWKTESMKEANIPDHVFTKDYLKAR